MRLPRVIFAVFSLALLAGAQQERNPRRATVHIPVWTTASEPLEAKEFRVLLNSRPAKVRSVKGPPDDLVILLAIDLTESLMLVESARQALAPIVESLPQNAYVAVLKAHDNLQAAVDPTADRAAVIRAVNEMPVTGKAGLLSTVEAGVQIGDALIEKSGVRAALFYVTDSDVRNYREDFTNPVINSSDHHDLSRRFGEGLIREKIQKVTGNLAHSETPLFFVHLDYRSDPINDAYQAGLLQLAASTGGAGIFCRSVGEVPEAIGKIAGYILGHWLLEAELPAARTKQIQVQVENGGSPLTFLPRFSLKGR